MASSGQRRGKRTLMAFTAGAISGTCATLMFQPLDLVKTRMQARSLALPISGTQVLLTTNGSASVGMFGTFTTVIRRENFISLWKGTSPSLQRCVPSIGAYFATVHFLQSMWGRTDGNITALQALSIGGGARSFAASLFLPFTVVKTRYESGQFQYRSVFQAMRSIWHTEGSKGLFSGWWATLARDAPFSALYLAFYTQSKQVVRKVTALDQLPSSYNLPCGIASGMLASMITQPADVIKTRMQVQPRSYPTIFHTVAAVVKKETFRGLFTGFAPRATRRTLMASFTWVFYEEIVRLIERAVER